MLSILLYTTYRRKEDKYMKLPNTRKYHYKGINPSKESQNMWLMILIGIALMAFIIFVL